MLSSREVQIFKSRVNEMLSEINEDVIYDCVDHLAELIRELEKYEKSEDKQ